MCDILGWTLPAPPCPTASNRPGSRHAAEGKGRFQTPTGSSSLLGEEAAAGPDGRMSGMSRSSLLVRWLPALGMMAAIFALSSLTSDRIPFFGEYDLLVKKGAHALGYAMLAAAYYFALPSRLSPVYRGLLSLLLAVLFARRDGFHQSFVRGRHSALRDVGIDSLGALPALLAATVYSSNSSSNSVS